MKNDIRFQLLSREWHTRHVVRLSFNAITIVIKNIRTKSILRKICLLYNNNISLCWIWHIMLMYASPRFLEAVLDRGVGL